MSESLNANEQALLMIMVEGVPIIDLGEDSRWSVPLAGLRQKGYVDGTDKFNHTITSAGRAALKAYEAEEENTFRALADKMRQEQGAGGSVAPVPVPARAPVTHGVERDGDRVIFRFRDGKTYILVCGEEWAGRIVELCNEPIF